MMAIHLFKRSPDINAWLRTFQQETEAVLLDVRTDEEYAQGHIPGSVHLELGRESELPRIAPDPRTPLYVYCYSGSRSESACKIFRRMGYPNVVNIGGIQAWKGAVEKGARAL